MDIKISLTGDLGSGKSTVTKIISDQYGCENYSTGKICRAIAESKGIYDIKEMNLYMKTHPEVDKEIDDGLVALSNHEGNIIIDSRMAWHFTKGTFKVYLSCAIDVAAERIFNDNRATESYASIEEMKQSNIQRKTAENGRYFELYGVRIFDMTNYDLIVDTTAASAKEAAEIITENCIKQQGGNKEYDGYLYPPRLFPTLDTSNADDDKEVIICCYNNNFYVLRGHKVVLEAIRNDEKLIPCKIVSPENPEFFENYSVGNYREWFTEYKNLGRREFTRY